MSSDSSLAGAVLNVKKTIKNVPVVGKLRVVKPLNPVKWGRLAQVVFGSTLVTISVVFQRLVGNVSDVLTSWFGGLSEWVGGYGGATVDQLRSLGVENPVSAAEGLVPATLGQFGDAVADSFPTAESLGPGALLLTIGITLLTVYTLVYGGREVIETLGGE